MKSLAYFHDARDNNFTFIRLVLAWLVLFGHSFPIAGAGSDPISLCLLPQAWLGSLAVSGFFAISGYLITASFVTRGSMDYIVARCLRLYPAVIVHCGVVILIIGPLAYEGSVAKYFSSNVFTYFSNATLWRWTQNLPNVFGDRPFSGSTNGAAWTLPVELRCYILIFVMGISGLLRRRWVANIFLVAIILCTLFSFKRIPLFGDDSRDIEPLLFFLAGSLTWVNRDRVPASRVVALVVVGMLVTFRGSRVFLYLYVAGFSYVLLIVAYKLPRVKIDRVGDLSYGIYLYAWPIQQLVWRPHQSGYTNAAIATAISAAIAYLSWSWIESPALRMKSRILRRSLFR